MLKYSTPKFDFVFASFFYMLKFDQIKNLVFFKNSTILIFFLKNSLNFSLLYLNNFTIKILEKLLLEIFFKNFLKTVLIKHNTYAILIICSQLILLTFLLVCLSIYYILISFSYLF